MERLLVVGERDDRTKAEVKFVVPWLTNRTSKSDISLEGSLLFEPSVHSLMRIVTTLASVQSDVNLPVVVAGIMEDHLARAEEEIGRAIGHTQFNAEVRKNAIALLPNIEEVE